MIVQGNYYCNLCSSSKDLIGLYWMPTGLDERAAQSVEHHICKDCLLSLEPITKKHRMPDKVEELIEAPTITPPELEPQVCDHYRQRALKAVEDWDGQDTDDLFDAICEAMGDQPKKWTRDPKPEPELRLPEGWTKEETQYGRHKDWHIEVLNSREVSHVESVIIDHPDRATAIRAAQAAVDEMEAKACAACRMPVEPSRDSAICETCHRQMEKRT